MSWQTRPYKLRFWLQLFSVILLLPLVAFSFYLVISNFQDQTEEGEQAMARRAQVIALAVNERLTQVEQVTQTLATSPFAEQGDIPHLYEFAATVQQRIPIISRFALVDPTGKAVFSTLYPLGRELGATPDLGDIQKVLATGKSAVSGFYRSASSHLNTVAVDVPLLRDGKVAYVLRALLFADSFDEMLRRQTMRAGWSASILDQNGVRLAGLPSAPALIGTPAPPSFIAAAQRGNGKIFDSGLLGGDSSRALVVPIAGSGWSVVANAPNAVLFQDLKRKLMELAFAIMVIFAGALTFSIVVARHVDREFRQALAGPMGFVGKTDQKPSRIAEATAIAQTRRESEEMRTLIAALESSEGAILITDRQGRIQWCNPAFASLTGFSRDEAIGRTPGQLVSSGLHDAAFYGQFWQALSSGAVWRGEVSNRRKDGSIFLVYQTVTPVLSPDDTISGFVAVAIDITARKSLEAEMTQRAEQFGLFIDQAPTAIAMFDREMRYLAVSRRWREAFRLGDRELTGKSHYDLFPGIPERWRDAHRKALAGEVLSRDEDHVVRKCGEDLWLRWEARPWQQPDGKIGGIVVFSEDITDRKIYENKAKESAAMTRSLLESHQDHLEQLIAERTAQLLDARNRTQMVLDSSADGIIGLDGQHNIVLCNPAALTLLGYRFEELQGRNVHDSIHYRHADGAHFPQNQCPAIEALRQGRAIRIEHDTFWHKDGHPISVSAATHPIIEEGRVAGAVMNFRDISDRLKVEAEREEARRSAERLARLKAEFLSNMSHEVRTPLNGILGLATVGLRESRDNPEALERFAAILNSGKLLLAIINDILDLSKIEAGKLVVEKIPFDPGQLCETALETVRASAEAKHLSMSLLKDATLPAVCLGDPTRIMQILFNFLSNAIKFTERGDVQVVLSGVDNQLKMAVSDSGIGIASEDLERMFQPFEQLDGSTTRKFGGTGLGLTISRRLAELMGGELLVRSAIGEGSTFELILPLVETDAPPRQMKADPEQHGTRLNGLRVLVAEDNEVNRFVLEVLLRREAAQVVSVADGQLAVEAIADNLSGFDVVLMDVQMPRMDGIEAARRILELVPGLPIIGQTAHALKEEHERYIAAGMATVVTKPIDEDTLIQAVLSWIPRPSHPGDGKPKSAAFSTLPAVDWKALLARFRGRRQTVANLIDLAVPTNEARIRTLRQLAEAGDVGQIAEVAHGLKGVAGTMAALEVEALAIRTLECARTGDGSIRDQAITLAEALERLVAVLGNGIPDEF